MLVTRSRAKRKEKELEDVNLKIQKRGGRYKQNDAQCKTFLLYRLARCEVKLRS